MSAYSGGNWLRQIGCQIIERGVDSTPKPARGKATDRLIDRNDAANLQRLHRFLFRAALAAAGIPQNLELRLHDLQLAAACIFLDLAVQCDHLPGCELVLQVRRIEPEAAQARPPLPDGKLENRHAPRAK